MHQSRIPRSCVLTTRATFPSTYDITINTQHKFLNEMLWAPLTPITYDNRSTCQCKHQFRNVTKRGIVYHHVEFAQLRNPTEMERHMYVPIGEEYTCM